jgi:hypothetical protein
MSEILIKIFELQERVASIVESFESAPSAEIDERLRMIEVSITVFQRRLECLLDPDTYTL